jgi:hypothetical protein
LWDEKVVAGDLGLEIIILKEKLSGKNLRKLDCDLLYECRLHQLESLGTGAANRPNSQFCTRDGDWNGE